MSRGTHFCSRICWTTHSHVHDATRVYWLDHAPPYRPFLLVRNVSLIRNNDGLMHRHLPWASQKCVAVSKSPVGRVRVFNLNFFWRKYSPLRVTYLHCRLLKSLALQVLTEFTLDVFPVARVSLTDINLMSCRVSALIGRLLLRHFCRYLTWRLKLLTRSCWHGM